MRALLPALFLCLAACSPKAQPNTTTLTSDEECVERRPVARRAVACETREYTLSTAPLRVDATPNGGISVQAWDRGDTLVRAKVNAWAVTQSEADALLSEVEVETQGSIRARLPEPHDTAWTSVSYEIFVPRTSDVDLRTVNGGITIQDVEGTIRFEAVNGGVTLTQVGGDVSGETVNGGIDIHLARGRWQGSGITVATQNGGIEVDVASGVSAEFDVQTRMGPIEIDGLPLEDQRCGDRASRRSGCLGGHVIGTLGDGGPMIRLQTTNGPIRLGQH